jgi:multidrug transporter EmrE-like cation transporter
LNTAAATSAAQTTTPSRTKAVALVFCCTILGAAAQILLKTGANQLAHPSPLAMLTNLPLLGGLSLYGVSTVLLVLALRDAELSLLYPVIALTYVWVTLLSLAIFHDRINPVKLAGVSIIVVGVGVLGFGSRK